MQLFYGVPEDIEKWMSLVTRVRWNFPGLETQEKLNEHRATVLKFMGKRQAICVKDENEIAGVMLFSRGHNMICCLAVAPEYRRRGVASTLMDEALNNLDRTKEISVSTFRADDEKGLAPRALYEKYGFIADALIEELNYPNQKYVLHPVGAERKKRQLYGCSYFTTPALQGYRCHVLIALRRSTDVLVDHHTIFVILSEITHSKDYSPEFIENDVRMFTPEGVIKRAGWTHFYVICDENLIIGCGAIGPYWDKEDEISFFNIFVLPEYQGRGVEGGSSKH